MAVAAILKFTLMATTRRLIIVEHIRTKFGTASKSDVSKTSLPLVFTSGKIQHIGKRHFGN